MDSRGISHCQSPASVRFISEIGFHSDSSTALCFFPTPFTFSLSQVFGPFFYSYLSLWPFQVCSSFAHFSSRFSISHFSDYWRHLWLPWFLHIFVIRPSNSLHIKFLFFTLYQNRSELQPRCTDNVLLPPCSLQILDFQQTPLPSSGLSSVGM